MKINTLSGFRDRCTRLPRDANDCWLWDGFFATNRYGFYGLYGKQWLAHRLSYIAFKSDIAEGMCVLHDCDNTKCVNPQHLRVGTQAENNQDRMRKGRSAVGENGRSKLTNVKVLEIRRLYASGNYTLDQLSVQFGVSNHQISQVANRKNWRHI